MATKLGIYNDALRAIGELRLTSLNEDVEARYVLDDAWEDAVLFCFTEGYWNFATKTEVITADLGQTPIPGFSFTFNKPLNWVRTITISPDSLFSDEATYRDEGNKFHANFDELYIRYICSEKAVDSEIANWPLNFGKLVGAYLAMECGERISGSKSNADALANLYKIALASTKNKDALDQAKVFLRPGNWIRAMRGGSLNRDRGPLSGY